ncbi:MAG: hypothetical protein ACKVOS_06000 [Sphingorhabdus sp.]|uniref:hypothetical protein n=1 Tax=Sphingorhabdus sp. TaxID=1902408 RepID=UPI0038FCF429
MSITRRELAKGAVLAATVVAATGVAACSPPPDNQFEIQQNFFGLVASRKLDEAATHLSPEVRLVVSTAKGVDMFAGPKNVIGKITSFFHSAGWRMIGDNSEFAPGGFWNNYGGWAVTDMVPRNLVELDLAGCGGSDMSNPVMNVFVLGGMERIEQIIMMESRTLNYARYSEDVRNELVRKNG